MGDDIMSAEQAERVLRHEAGHMAVPDFYECPHCGGDLRCLPCGMLGWLCSKCGARVWGGGQGHGPDEPGPRLKVAKGGPS
jgi:hypothetical protein